MSEEVGLYQFIPDATACDICESMAGTYEDAPHVPVHPNCNCQVIALAGDDNDCVYWIDEASLTLDQENYTETQSLWLDIPSTLTEDTDISVTVELGLVESNFDEGVLEAVQNKFGWSEHNYQVIIGVTIPAGTVGTVQLEVEFDMANTIYTGERRRTCNIPNDDGSFTAEFADLGNVGGYTLERTDVASFDFHDPEPGNDSDFFSSPDESPFKFASQ